ncbi:MAG: alpha/beta hydrolase, partial [Anaerolineales bacterium]
RCGTLFVHEEHADASSPALQLAVAILPALSADPATDPLVFNQGGPGFGSIDTYLSLLMKSPLRARRDLVLYDQRGTGYSQPALACPEVIDYGIANLNQILSAQEADAGYNAAALQCRDRLVQAGVNLSAYNTEESAGDLNDLRQALGYTQLNLYGVSYGSLLVLDTLRFYPAAVRSAIIGGVVPPQANMNTQAPFSIDRAYTQLFKACAADARCNAAYPSLEATLFELVARLNREPARINVLDPDTGRSYPALLNGDGLLGALFQAFYISDLIPLLPEVIHRADKGNYSALEPIVSLTAFDRTWMVGMYWSVYCAEDSNFDPATITYPDVRPQLSKDQAEVNRAIQSLCQAWRVRDLAPALNQPVVSGVPTLVLNGRFDPITPPANGILAAQTLSTSTVITFPTTSHGAFPAGDPCISKLISAFVDQPQLVVDTKCVDTQPALVFETTSTLVNFSVIDFANGLVAQRAALLLPLGLAGLAILVLLSGLLLFPLSWLLKRKGKPPEEGELPAVDPAMMASASAPDFATMFSKPPEIDASGALVNFAPWFAILSGLLPLVFVGLAVYFIGPLVVQNRAVLLLGLPGSLTWLFFVPLANLVLALLVPAATVAGLLSGKWSGRRLAYFSLLSLAALTLIVALGLLGLLTALLPQGLALISGLLGNG